MPGGRRIAHTPHSKNLKCSKSIFRRVVLVRRQTALSGQWKSRYPKSGSVARLHFHVLFGNRAAFSSVCMGTDGESHACSGGGDQLRGIHVEIGHRVGADGGIIIRVHVVRVGLGRISAGEQRAFELAVAHLRHAVNHLHGTKGVEQARHVAASPSCCG